MNGGLGPVERSGLQAVVVTSKYSEVGYIKTAGKGTAAPHAETVMAYRVHL